MGRAVSSSTGLQVDMRPLAYRVERAAELLGIGKSKMWEMVAAKRIRTRKIDGATIILRSDLEAFLDALPEDGAGDAE